MSVHLDLVPSCEALIAIATLYQGLLDRLPIDALGMVMEEERRKEGGRVSLWQWLKAGFVYLWVRGDKTLNQAKYRTPGSAEVALKLSDCYDHGLGGRQVQWVTRRFFLRGLAPKPKALYFPTFEAVRESDSRLGPWWWLSIGTTLVVMAEFIEVMTRASIDDDARDGTSAGLLVLTVGGIVLGVWNWYTSRRLAGLYAAELATVRAEMAKSKSDAPLSAGSLQTTRVQEDPENE